jgi:hypothetical protein
MWRYAFNFWQLSLRGSFALALGWLLFNSSMSRAETTNKRLILPGARAQALGGAFTAVADDASASWYNPAGLGQFNGSGFSLTVNNYSRSHKDVAGRTTQSKIAENSSSIYPGFAGGHAKFGGIALGWSYFTVEQQNTDESQKLEIPASQTSGAYQYDRAELTSGNMIYAGLSTAIPLGKYISLGVSEFYYRRQKQTALKERSLFESGIFYDSFVRQSTRNEGTLTTAGIMLKTSAVSLGLSAKIPKALSDKTDLETSSIIYAETTPELSSETRQTHREDELIVRTWSLGMAFKPSTWALFSADLIHYPATKTPWPNTGGFDTKDVTDWSVGIELSAGSLVVDGGVFTNSSLVMTPKPSLVSSEPARIDYQGFSCGLGLKSKQSETQIIMVRQLGAGKTQLIQGDLSLQDISIETQSFSISSRYLF